MRSVLVDAGPLIALADRSDKHPRRVAAFLRRFNGRLLTTWPVLAEIYLKDFSVYRLPNGKALKPVL